MYDSKPFFVIKRTPPKDERKQMRKVRRFVWTEEAQARAVILAPKDSRTSLGMGLVYQRKIIALNPDIGQPKKEGKDFSNSTSVKGCVRVSYFSDSEPADAIFVTTAHPYPVEISLLQPGRHSEPFIFSDLMPCQDGQEGTQEEYFEKDSPAYFVNNMGILCAATIIDAFHIPAEEAIDFYEDVDRTTVWYGSSVYDADGNLLGMCLGPKKDSLEEIVVLPSRTIAECINGDMSEVRCHEYESVVA